MSEQGDKTPARGYQKTVLRKYASPRKPGDEPIEVIEIEEEIPAEQAAALLGQPSPTDGDS